VFDLVEVGGGHHDALEGVLRGEDDVLLAAAFGGEGDVGDLLVLAVDLAGVFVEGVDLDGLAEDVVVAGLGELGLAGGEFLDNLVDGEAGGGGGVELAEAGGILGRFIGAVLRIRAVWMLVDSGLAWYPPSAISVKYSKHAF
jgi:hypothetical protein